MAFDEALAGRVRSELAGRTGVVEKKMFGGLAFMVRGNMSVGVHGDELVVRMSAPEAEAELGLPGVRPFDITGRPMKGWLLVSAEALETPHALSRWVERGVSFAESLPPK